MKALRRIGVVNHESALTFVRLCRVYRVCGLWLLFFVRFRVKALGKAAFKAGGCELGLHILCAALRFRA